MDVIGKTLGNILGKKKPSYGFRSGGKGQSKQEHKITLNTHMPDTLVSKEEYGNFSREKNRYKQELDWAEKRYGKGKNEVVVYDALEDNMYGYGQNKQAIKGALRQQYLKTLKDAGNLRPEEYKMLRRGGFPPRRR